MRPRALLERMRFSIGTKLAIVCLAFTLPILVLVGLVVTDRHQSKAAAAAELDGLERLTALRLLRADLLGARALAPAAAAGDRRAASALRRDHGAIGERLDAGSGDLAALRMRWDEAQPRLDAPGRADGVYRELIAGTRAAGLEVGADSRLLLDPVVEGTWLVDRLVRDLPTLDVLRSDLLQASMRPAARGALLPAERAEIVALTAQLDRVLAGVEDGAARAGAIPRDGSSASASSVSELVTTHRDLIVLATQRIIVPAQPQAGGEELRAAEASATQASLALWDASRDRTAALLTARIDALDRGARTAAAVTAGVLALIVAVVGAVIRSIRRPLRQAAEAARRIRAGELDADIPAHRGDEIGHMLEAMQELTGYLRDMALLDPLTGLANRTLFTDRLQHAISRLERGSAGVGVLFCDLDHFKEINDTLGHAAGDDLLQAVADRLKHSVRPSDTLARFGGDEFTVLIEDVASVEQAVSTADRVAQAMRQPFPIADRELHVSTSVGIAYSDRPGVRSGDLLRDADVALYRSKAEGRARHTVFVENMAADALEHLRLDGELRLAVERDELRLFFQPEVNLATGAIVGAEALVRWERPDHGLVSPESFIGAAEANGTILGIGTWVLEQACEWAVRWHDETGSSPFVAVNLSPRQLHADGLVDQVADVLASSGLDSRRLRLEITESSIMDDGDRAIALLSELRALGVRLAIDDFGTGYSSLNYLQQLPVDIVKIDRTFIGGVAGDQKTRLIVGSVVRLAKALGLAAIAEGVETDEQRSVLRGLGCRWGQGYLFARPLAAAASLELLRGWDDGVSGRVPQRRLARARAS